MVGVDYIKCLTHPVVRDDELPFQSDELGLRVIVVDQLHLLNVAVVVVVLVHLAIG